MCAWQSVLLFHFFETLLHIFRKRRIKMHPFACDRVAKLQRSGVKRLTADGVVSVRGIQGVAKQRMADGSHVNADLVGAPCFQFETDMGSFGSAAQSTEVCDGRISVQRICGPLDGGAFLPADRRPGRGGNE